MSGVESEEDDTQYFCGFCQENVSAGDYFYEHKCFRNYNQIYIDPESNLVYPTKDDNTIVWIPETESDPEFVAQDLENSCPNAPPNQSRLERKRKANSNDINDSTNKKKKKKPLDVDQVDELISEVEKRECLLKEKARTNPNDREKSKVMQEWAALAELPVFKGQITGEEARAKFKNLVDTMRRHTKKLPSGSGSKPRAVWAFYDRLQFIRDQWNDNEPTVCNIPIEIRAGCGDASIGQENVEVAEELSADDHQETQEHYNQTEAYSHDQAAQQHLRYGVEKQQRRVASNAAVQKTPVKQPDINNNGITPVKKTSRPRSGGNSGSNVAEAIVELANAVREEPLLPTLAPAPTQDFVDGMLTQVGSYVRSIQNLPRRLAFNKEIGDYAYNRMVFHLQEETQNNNNNNNSSV